MADSERAVDPAAVGPLFAEFCRLTEAMLCSLTENRFDSFLAQSEERNGIEESLRLQAGTRWLAAIPELRPAAERAFQQNESIMKLLDGLKQETQDLLASSHRQQRLMNLYRP